MTKHLYKLATEVQTQLRQLAQRAPSDVPWVRGVPRVLLDSWATLHAWNAHGEPVLRITEEQEGDLLTETLPLDLSFVKAPVRHEALACQLPERSQWIIIARHPAMQTHAVYQTLSWTEKSPLLTYVTEVDGGLRAGYINLLHQPTPAQMSLIPGRSLRLDGIFRDLNEAEITEEDYRLTLAMCALYRA